MIRNTGKIIGKARVCEYTGEVVIDRERTMYDVARKMERDAVRRKATEMSRTKSKVQCAES